MIILRVSLLSSLSNLHYLEWLHECALIISYVLHDSTVSLSFEDSLAVYYTCPQIHPVIERKQITLGLFLNLSPALMCNFLSIIFLSIR